MTPLPDPEQIGVVLENTLDGKPVAPYVPSARRRIQAATASARPKRLRPRYHPLATGGPFDTVTEK